MSNRYTTNPALIFIPIVLGIIVTMSMLGCEPDRGEKALVSEPTNTSIQEEGIKTQFEYRKVTETSGATSYIFSEDKKPRLELNADAAIGNLEAVNAVLIYLNLPEVTKSVPERSSITGYRFHRAQYYWDDYPLGSLTIERTLCGNSSKRYDCIWKVTVNN